MEGTGALPPCVLQYERQSCTLEWVSFSGDFKNKEAVAAFMSLFWGGCCDMDAVGDAWFSCGKRGNKGAIFGVVRWYASVDP